MSFFADWPAVAADDADQMLDVLGPLTQQGLARDGELWPVGAGVDHDGEIAPFAVYPTYESTREAAEFLVKSTIRQRDSWRTVLIADTTEWPDSSGALRFHVETADGHSRALMMPYQVSGFRKKVTFGEFTSVDTPPVIWGAAQVELLEAEPDPDEADVTPLEEFAHWPAVAADDAARLLHMFGPFA